MDTRDEAPVSLIGEFVDTMDGIAVRRDKQHAAACPALQDWQHQHADGAPVEAGEQSELPFDNQHIPRKLLNEVAEQMERRKLTVFEAAEEYDLPVKLLQRELAKLEAEFQRDLLRRADPWDLRWSRRKPA